MRLRPRLLGSTNYIQFQSAYRERRYREIALLKVLDGIYVAADDKQFTV